MTALVLVIGGLLLADGVGLGLQVDSPMWWLTRPLWLGVLTAITWPFIQAFGRFERPGNDRRPAPRAWRPVAATVLTCAGLGFLAASGVADDQGPHGLILSLPFIAVIAGGISGARHADLPGSVSSQPAVVGPGCRR
jgi:hypothetical protein